MVGLAAPVLLPHREYLVPTVCPQQLNDSERLDGVGGRRELGRTDPARPVSRHSPPIFFPVAKGNSTLCDLSVSG